MDWKLILELVLAVAATTAAVVTTLIVFLRKMDAKFAESMATQVSNFQAIRDENRNSFHSLTMKVQIVETTVGPYAQDINMLKETQNANIVKITELEAALSSLSNSHNRVERQVENLQNRNR